MREQLAQIRQQLTVVQTELAKAPPPPEAEDETTTAEAFEALQRELAAFIHLAESFMATYVKDIRCFVPLRSRCAPTTVFPPLSAGRCLHMFQAMGEHL